MNYYKFDWDTKQVLPSEDRTNRSEQIAVTYIDGVETRVSTVFLSSDHGFGLSEKPIVFETMIFGGPHDDYCQRADNYDVAMRLHNEAVREAIKASLWHTARSILHRTEQDFPPSYPIEVGAHALADRAAHLWPEAMRILKALPQMQQNINDLISQQREMIDMMQRRIDELEAAERKEQHTW
jgi:hypothetical protein